MKEDPHMSMTKKATEKIQFFGDYAIGCPYVPATTKARSTANLYED